MYQYIPLKNWQTVSIQTLNHLVQWQLQKLDKLRFYSLSRYSVEGVCLSTKQNI